jgi:hypothetical protein
VKLSQEFELLRGTLGVKVVICKPGDQEAKGLVERFNGYLGSSFLPGRQVTSPAGFNAQVHAWITQKALLRNHQTLGCRPVDRVAADKAAMLALPPITQKAPWSSLIRLPRDHYVGVGSNDFSVDPIVIGRRAYITADLRDVTIRWGERIVGHHHRHWGKH